MSAHITHDEIKSRLSGLRELLNTEVGFTIDRYDDRYVDKRYLGCWYATIELPNCESLGYDQLLAIAAHLGTTTLNFQSATEHGYYGEVDNIVRIWAVWTDDARPRTY